MEFYSVYKHTLPKEVGHKDNDMFYIGITKNDVKKRWQNGLGYRHNSYFNNAIQKYGKDNFLHEVLFSGLTKEEAEQKEIEMIAYYKSNQREYGYNISNGGECLGKHSEETRQKMRDNHADFSGENHPNYGKHHSEETKMILSQKAKERYEENGHPSKGRVMSEEQKNLLSEIAKERLSVPENNPFYGKRHTEETKKILSEKAKNRHRNQTKKPIYNTKKVICLDDNTIYPSVRYVSEKFGLPMAALYANCQGKSDKCGGYRFRYLDTVERMVS